MKRLFKLFTLALVALAVVACDKPQENPGNDPGAGENKAAEISYVITSGETAGEPVKFSYNKTSNVYTAEINVLPNFTSISFYKDNALLDSETTNITGNFSKDSTAAALCHMDEDTSVFYKGDLNISKLTITYLGNSSTLNIEAEEASLIDSLASVVISGKANKASSNSASIFDAGQKLREFNEGVKTVLAEAHVLYLVVDAEGKIVYIAQNQTFGYAGPNDDFYCHSSYKAAAGEYNVVFNILDTYQPWTPEATGGVWNHFEIVVPQGGFAVVAHGDVVRDIFTALGVPSNIVDLHSQITDSKDAFSPAVNVSTLLDNNTHNVAADSLRLTLEGNKLHVIFTGCCFI